MLGTFVLLQLTIIWSTEAASHTLVNLPNQRLVIIGATGVGKSTISNFLLGCQRDCLPERFKTCYNDSPSCTKEVSYGIGMKKSTENSLAFVWK